MTSDISTTSTLVEFSTLSMLSLLSLFLLERHGSLAQYREIHEFLSVVVDSISSSQIHVISGLGSCKFTFSFRRIAKNVFLIRSQWKNRNARVRVFRECIWSFYQKCMFCTSSKDASSPSTKNGGAKTWGMMPHVLDILRRQYCCHASYAPS